MKLGMLVGLGPGHIVLDGDPALLLKKGAEPPIFGPCLLWSNGWMDQDGTWHEGMPRPRRHCVRWGPSSPPQKGSGAPNFGPCLLWSNGWMDQYGTWHEGMPRPRRHCVRWGPSSPRERGTAAPPLFGPYLLWPRSLISATAELLLHSSWQKVTIIYNRRPYPPELPLQMGDLDPM